MGLGTAMLLSDGIDTALAQLEEEIQGSRINFFDWALKVPEPKAGRLDFNTFPFQVELYKQGVDDKHGVVCKGTQVGMSAWTVRWCLYHADTKGMTGLYVFPTVQLMWDFASIRVNPLLDGSQYLRNRRTPEDPDNKGMKGLGLGVVVFRGSESKRGLDSVDADHIVFDEYDTLAQANIPDAEMRVSSPLSPGLIRRIGTPTDADWGIHQAFMESDQRYWMTKCESCGEWQDMDFWKNVDLVTAKRVCRECRKPINVARGQWVAKHPDSDVRGYHVTRLIAPTADLGPTIKLSKKRTPEQVQVFHNKHLGLPYSTAEGGLTKEAIAAAQSAGNGYMAATRIDDALGQPNVDKLRTAGIDVASTRALNVRVSEHEADGSKKALFIGTVDTFDELYVLLQRLQVQMFAVDHLPDGRLARELVERLPGRGFIVHYETSITSTDPRVLKPVPEMRTVGVRRTEALDATFEMIRQMRNRLPVNLPEEYVDHMRAEKRQIERDNLGRRVVRYERKGEASDFAHAEVYDVVATECWWFMQGVEEAGREVLHPLEDMFEFQRSDLSVLDDDAPDYATGGMPDDDFNFGPDAGDYNYDE